MSTYAEAFPTSIEARSPADRFAISGQAARLALKSMRLRLQERGAAKQARFAEGAAAREAANQRLETTALPLVHDILARKANSSENTFKATYTNPEGQSISIQNIKLEPKTAKPLAEYGLWRVSDGANDTLFRLYPDGAHQKPEVAMETDGKRQELFMLDQNQEAGVVNGLASNLEQLAAGMGRSNRGEEPGSFRIEEVIPEPVVAQHRSKAKLATARIATV